MAGMNLTTPDNIYSTKQKATIKKGIKYYFAVSLQPAESELQYISALFAFFSGGLGLYRVW